MKKAKSKPTLREQLAAPFDPAELRWKPGSKSGDKKRAMIMPYVTGRAIMDRLDLVFGPAGWSDSYERIDGKAWRCRITATIDGRDVFKEGLSDEPQIEAIKGGASGALKRAAVKWGIGRYLYRLPAVWVDIKNGYARGNAVDIRDGREHLGHCVPPALPDWARPAGHSKPQATAPSKPRKPPEPLPKHDPSWHRGKGAFFASLNDLGLSDEGLQYAHICRFLAHHKRPRPSAMDDATRDKLIGWLSIADVWDGFVQFCNLDVGGQAK